jgi:hypothetical protein
MMKSSDDADDLVRMMVKMNTEGMWGEDEFEGEKGAKRYEGCLRKEETCFEGQAPIDGGQIRAGVIKLIEVEDRNKQLLELALADSEFAVVARGSMTPEELVKMQTLMEATLTETKVSTHMY